MATKLRYVPKVVNMSRKANLKSPDNYIKAVEDYKDKYKKEAEILVKQVFPKKITELNTLLEDERFALRRLPEISDELNIPIPDPAEYNVSDDEPVAKKARRDVLANNLMSPKVLLLPNGVAPTNKKISELCNLIKPHIIDLMDHANKIKMWITYLMPKIEDGNNFGVEIQEETLGEANAIEAEAATYLDAISGYFMARGRIIGKIAKYPHVEDIRRTVTELDEKEFITLRLLCCELRNRYANLHDLIIKNFEKITKPRSSNTLSMF